MYALYVDAGSGSMLVVPVVVAVVFGIGIVAFVADRLGYSRWWGLGAIFLPALAVALVLLVVDRSRGRATG